MSHIFTNVNYICRYVYSFCDDNVIAMIEKFIVDAFLRKFRIIKCFLKFSIHYIEVCFPSTHVSSERHKMEEQKNINSIAIVLLLACEKLLHVSVYYEHVQRISHVRRHFVSILSTTYTKDSLQSASRILLLVTY